MYAMYVCYVCMLCYVGAMQRLPYPTVPLESAHWKSPSWASYDLWVSDYWHGGTGDHSTCFDTPLQTASSGV